MKEKSLELDELSNWLPKDGNVVVAFSPQMHLTPYVFALLCSKNLLFNPVVVIGDSTACERSSLIQFPNIFFVNQQLFIGGKKEFFNELLDVILNKSLTIDSFVIHNFAHELNMAFVEYFVDPCLCPTKFTGFCLNSRFYIYADGSRNNPMPEQDAFIEIGTVAKRLSKMGIAYEMNYFGFRYDYYPPHEFENVIGYQFVQPYYQLGPVQTSVVLKNINILNPPVVLVLARYIGRGPYKLPVNTIDSISRFFVDCIVDAINLDSSVIVRYDNRFLEIQDTVDSLIAQKFNQAIDLSDLVDVCPHLDLDTILMERIAIENPALVGKLDEVYCFDSSFPLVFQSKNVYRSFPVNCSIICGFSLKCLKAYDVTDEFYDLIRSRTVSVLFHALQLKLFRLYTLSGCLIFDPVCDTPVYTKIDDLFMDNNGLLRLVPF